MHADAREMDGARAMGGDGERTRLVPAWQVADDASEGARHLGRQPGGLSGASRWWALAFVVFAVTMVGAGIVTRQRALLVLERATAAEEAAADLDSGVIPQAAQAACPAPITDFKLTECARAADQHALGVAGKA